MRSVAAASLLVLMFVGCSPVREATAPRAASVSSVVKPAVAAVVPVMPSHPVAPPRATGGEIAGIVFEGVAFDSRSHRLVVTDQSGGPGSQFADAAAAGRSRGGLAAVNAGFFTPEGAPLGLVVSSGKRAGAWNSASSLGSGILHEDSSGRSAVSRRENIGRVGAAGMRELIQAGPMLIENSRRVSGLDAIKSSVRIMVLWDGGSRWWFGRASACTLAGLSSALVVGRPAGWPVRHALNLDGGRSADLWISEAVEGGPVVRRPAWNRPVRNFLILIPR